VTSAQQLVAEMWFDYYCYLDDSTQTRSVQQYSVVICNRFTFFC